MKRKHCEKKTRGRGEKKKTPAGAGHPAGHFLSFIISGVKGMEK